MPDFFVLKQIGDGGQAVDWQPVVIARGLEEGQEEEAVGQGYTGEGRYKAIAWPAPEDSEFDVGPPGPPTATPATPAEVPAE
jgi:hypothetical protein